MINIALWSLALVVSALGLLVSMNSARFARSVAGEARRLWSLPGSSSARASVPAAALPEPVRRYLTLAGAGADRPPLASARVRHRGSMTLQPGARPVPVRGQQYFAADPPGFVWWGRVRVVPGIWIDARDQVVAGRAGMRVMFESSKTLQDAAGPQLDQSALVRLLGELVFLPSALRDPRYVRWEPIDGQSARAHLGVAGQDVEAVFHFGPDGMPERFTGQRYRDAGPGRPAVLTPFLGLLRDWREVNGRQVPFRVEGAWLLDGGPFTFAHFEVEDVEFDRREPF